MDPRNMQLNIADLITISEYPARHLLVQTNLRYNYFLD